MVKRNVALERGGIALKQNRKEFREESQTADDHPVIEFFLFLYKAGKRMQSGLVRSLTSGSAVPASVFLPVRCLLWGTLYMAPYLSWPDLF